ncbi:MAG: 3-deoxy-D-manno-octulosonate 8-phosphate phosphatase [Saprospiraceae bacterium]|nr:MAG: 3-deoxy-D-manno-octulosonate 8-phosphate phosphatase [Saprospiraceae bacterium]
MNQLEKFREIRTFIFDVDGVLTNSEVLVMENGQLLRKMNIRDGYAIKKAIKEGYRVAVITGGKSEGVRERLKALGVIDIYSGVDDKLEAYEELVDIYDLDEGQILYMGDDLPDYAVLRRVGLACVPQDAAPDLFRIAQYVSPRTGGDGCARDVIEKVLRLNEKWSEE